jgi:hypothetical protein
MRNARHIMTTYRRFLIQTKAKWNLQLTSNGRPPARRVLRGIIHYRAYVQSYLKAKRAVIAGLEMVDA